MRHIASLWRIAITLLLLLPCGAQGQFTFKTNYGTITITGYLGTNSSIAIPDWTNGYPVKSVAQWLVCYQKEVTEIQIGTNATEIGTPLAYACPKLTQITVDAKNARYSSLDGVLFDKNRLTLVQFPCGRSGSYNIPSTVSTIGWNAFYACFYLTNITIPRSVYTIAPWAFYGCSGLPSITIPDSVNSIGAIAFESCRGLTNVVLGRHITAIGDLAFSGCSALKSIELPPNLVSLGKSVFCACVSLTNATIPASLTAIPESTFQSCVSLQSITLPATVASVGSYAFYNCTGLKDVFCLGNAPVFGINAFGDTDGVTVHYLPEMAGWGVRMQTETRGFGISTNQPGFTINGTAGMEVVVQACTDLQNPAWLNVSTNRLENSSTRFEDGDWTKYPSRFYRLGDPTISGRPLVPVRK